MTNITFAELTALIGVSGLTVNDRYFITDKNWTIIAISANSYRIVVPIVTEVTKSELDALVTDDGLNEGLQYKVTDKGYNVLATSANTYIITGAIPYKKWIGTLVSDGINDPIVSTLENTIGAIVWTRDAQGLYFGTLIGAFQTNKTFFSQTVLFADINLAMDGEVGTLSIQTEDFVLFAVTIPGGTNFDGWTETAMIEIRVYY